MSSHVTSPTRAIQVPPPMTAPTMAAPVTVNAAAMSHHRRNVDARSRGPETTWSIHGRGGRAGPRTRPDLHATASPIPAAAATTAAPCHDSNCPRSLSGSWVAKNACAAVTPYMSSSNAAT